MNKLLSLMLLIVVACQRPDSAVLPTPAGPSSTTNVISTSPTNPSFTVVTGSGSGPRILEAEADGIGKALIAGHTITLKLPAGYTKSAVQLRYKVSEGVRKVTSLTGAFVPIRNVMLPTVCIQEDPLGNCTLPYQIILETVSPIVINTNPASQQLELTQYYQPYSLTYTVGNLNAGMPISRRFKIRFVNKANQYTFTGEHCMVYDLAGNPVYTNQAHQGNLNVPSQGRLNMAGTLPVDMPAGDYAVTIITETFNGANQGTESVELATPLRLTAGPPLIGEVYLSGAPINTLMVAGRNLTPAKGVAIRISKDFTTPYTAEAAVVSEANAQLPLRNGLAEGQYRLDVTPDGGKPYRSLFTIPAPQTAGSFAYVAPLGSFTATQDWIPTLPILKGGDRLEVRYNFATGDRSYSAYLSRTVPYVRLISVTNPAQHYDLQSEGRFTPFILATDFFLWRWQLPVNVPSGHYKLVFEDENRLVSEPYFQQIQLN